MPLIDIEDNGDGSAYVIHPLPDAEFVRLAPPRHRVWLVPEVYRSVSGRVVPRHDPYQDALNIINYPVRALLALAVLAGLFGVLLCCFPVLAHLVF